MQRLAALLKLPAETDADILFTTLALRRWKRSWHNRPGPIPRTMCPQRRWRNCCATGMPISRYGAEATANAPATDKLADAIRTGHIIPVMREWATALCTQDPDSFETFIRQSAPAYAHLTRPLNFGKTPPPYAKTHDSDVAAAICTQLGLPPGSLNT